MREKDLKEGLGELADMAERDHEVQMARADLYKIAKYAIKLHDMLKGVSEAEGLEGWQQSKITKAADYISSVYHNLDYEMKFEDQPELGEETVEEGKFKSAAHRKAIHAAKASGKRKGLGKKLRKESLQDRLAAKLNEKSVSKAQQQAAGIALAAKRKGEKPKGKGAAAQMAKMSTKELEKFAGTKHKGLPKHKD
jgi:hypothetical protein